MLPHFSLIVYNASAEYRGSSYSAFVACFYMILGDLSANSKGSCLVRELSSVGCDCAAGLKCDLTGWAGSQGLRARQARIRLPV
jgi:hypothetical protein